MKYLPLGALALACALTACGNVTDAEAPDAGADNQADAMANGGPDADPLAPDADVATPDAGQNADPDAAIACTGEASTLAAGTPQGGFSAAKTIAIEVTPLGDDRAIEQIEVQGINLFGGTYTMGARIYDVDSGELVASSDDVTITGPFPNYTNAFDVSAVLTAGRSYYLGIFTTGGATAAEAVLLTDVDPPFDDTLGAFRTEGAASTINTDAFPNLGLNGLPQITAHSCPQ